jgi:thiamine-monophosphate kinase
MKLHDLGEDQFLERLRQRVPKPGPEVRLGIGDDAAALAIPPKGATLVSVDVLVEGVHFTRQTLPPRFIGRKAAAVNASDIAAMGGRPIGFLLSLKAPPDSGVEELLELFDGFIERSGELGTDLVGGNLSATPGPMVLDVTIVGVGRGGKFLERKGARAGDGLYVSGKLGAAPEGLRLLKEGMAFSASGALLVPAALRSGPIPLAEQCLRAHMDPVPRLELGQFLCESQGASACIDLSDGLAMDLNRLCSASGVGARVEENALPIHPGVLAWERLMKRDPVDLALAGGEDYELLFTARSDKRLEEWRRGEGVAITRIGRVTKSGEGIRLVLREGGEREIAASGWDHFRSEPATTRGA